MKSHKFQSKINNQTSLSYFCLKYIQSNLEIQITVDRIMIFSINLLATNLKMKVTLKVKATKKQDYLYLFKQNHHQKKL